MGSLLVVRVAFLPVVGGTADLKRCCAPLAVAETRVFCSKSTAFPRALPLCLHAALDAACGKS